MDRRHRWPPPCHALSYFPSHFARTKTQHISVPIVRRVKKFPAVDFSNSDISPPPQNSPFLPSLCEMGLSLLQRSFHSHNPDYALWCMECRLLAKRSFCQELQEVFNNLSVLTPAPPPPNFKATIRTPCPTNRLTVWPMAKGQSI